jgi:CRISPR-associated protein Csx14
VAEASIPVDLFNPGQVFACIGFVEAAQVLLSDAKGAFDWSEPSQSIFHLRAHGEDSPVEEVLAFLERAEALGELPAGSPNFDAWNEKWGRLVAVPREHGFPYPDPGSPATAVCLMTDGKASLRLDHWGDATRRDNVKFWAGGSGYPGVALARDALTLIRARAVDAADDPFALSQPQRSSFRLDWRRDYIPIDAGFSLNRHVNSIISVGYPIVELLAAVGLSHARPLRPSWHDKLAYRYAVVGRAEPSHNVWLPPALMRSALGCVDLPFPTRRFRIALNWPGQEDQARAITNVTEEIGQ